MYRYKTKEELTTSMDTLKKLIVAIQQGSEQQVTSLLAADMPYVNELVDLSEDGVSCSSAGRSPLMIASELGQLRIVRQLLDCDEIDVNVEDSDSWTALVYALKERHVQVAQLLLENDAALRKPDRNHWTPLTWACFLDLPDLVPLMVDKGAMIEHKDSYGVSCLSWAAGRGNTEVVAQLLERINPETINSADKYGTTALLWSCRKGHFDCASLLLNYGADVNMSGMNGWTPLIASVCVNNQRLVDLLLSCRNPSVQIDCVDKSGMTALMYAAKQGSVEITEALIDAKAFVNKVDQKGDSALIHAVKNDHREVVQVLVNQGVDVDLVGSENKVSLMIAIEKNETEIASILVREGDAKVNITNSSGETCLIRATKKSNYKIVELLLEHGANVFDTDSDGNTAVHIAVKGKMGPITQLLLSNPKHGRILYMPNKAGETPYNLDTSQNEGHVLNQVFGARRFLPAEEHETSHQLLGYHLYSASLADFFSEPSLSLPITLGLFARWGSGKSHFLPRLENDMKTFCQPLPVSHQSDKRWIIYLILLAFAAVVVLFGYFAPHGLAIKITIMGIGLSLFLLPVIIIETIRCCARRFEGAHSAIDKIDNYLAYFHLLICITFLRPPSNRGRRTQDLNEALPMRYLFSDRSRIADISEESGVAKLVASLCAEAELEYGFLAFRLLQASLKSNHGRQSIFKLTFCMPTFVHLVLFVLLLLTMGLLLMLDARKYLIASIALGSLALFILLIHFPTIVRVCQSFHRSQYKQARRLAEKFNTMPEGKFVQQLKHNVESLANIVIGIDQFAMRSTRMVVFLDGLDRCEQDKLMKIIELVTILFCYPGMPFIVVYCLDPVSIIKSIEQRITNQSINQNIRSYEYMRTIVHLPFYFPDKSRESYFLDALKGLVSSSFMQSQDMISNDRSPPRPVPSRAIGRENATTRVTLPKDQSTHHAPSLGVASSHMYQSCVLSTWNLSKMLSSDRDCLHDLNPKEMQRLINIISVTGRLLRAYRVSFDWKKLAYWVHLTERWSYHTSWMMFYLLKNAWKYRLNSSLKDVFEDLKMSLPPVKNDKMFDNDSERRFLELFLSNHHPQLLLSDIKNFYPHTINLDPSLKSYIDIAPSESCDVLTDIGRNDAVNTATGPRAIPTSLMGLVTTSTAPRDGFLTSSSAYLNSINAVTATTAGISASAEEHNRDVRVTRSASRHPSANQPIGLNRNKPLTEYSLDDICNVLSTEIEGIDSARLYDYRNILKSQNINGRVLAVCDMDELKCYLNMTFGDWNLFKQWVYGKRMGSDGEEESETTSRSINDDENQALTLNEEASRSPIDEGYSTTQFRNVALPLGELSATYDPNAIQETEHVSFSTADTVLNRDQRGSRTSRTFDGASTSIGTNSNFTAISESTVKPQETHELKSHLTFANQVIANSTSNQVGFLDYANDGITTPNNRRNQISLREIRQEDTSHIHHQIAPSKVSSPVLTPSRFTVTAASLDSNQPSCSETQNCQIVAQIESVSPDEGNFISETFKNDFLKPPRESKGTLDNREANSCQDSPRRRTATFASTASRGRNHVDSRPYSGIETPTDLRGILSPGVVTRRSRSSGRRCSFGNIGEEFSLPGKETDAQISTSYQKFKPSIDEDLALNLCSDSQSLKSPVSVYQRFKRSLSSNTLWRINTANSGSCSPKPRSKFETEKLPFCVQETELAESQVVLRNVKNAKNQNRISCVAEISTDLNRTGSENINSSFV